MKTMVLGILVSLMVSCGGEESISQGNGEFSIESNGLSDLVVSNSVLIVGWNVAALYPSQSRGVHYFHKDIPLLVKEAQDIGLMVYGLQGRGLSVPTYPEGMSEGVDICTAMAESMLSQAMVNESVLHVTPRGMALYPTKSGGVNYYYADEECRNYPEAAANLGIGVVDDPDFPIPSRDR
ncbi:MAG: hypothetical protein AB7T49_08700 [Oligoflexales bacterium]